VCQVESARAMKEDKKLIQVVGRPAFIVVDAAVIANLVMTSELPRLLEHQYGVVSLGK
jgi:hypothetical protein